MLLSIAHLLELAIDNSLSFKGWCRLLDNRSQGGQGGGDQAGGGGGEGGGERKSGGSQDLWCKPAERHGGHLLGSAKLRKLTKTIFV